MGCGSPTHPRTGRFEVRTQVAAANGGVDHLMNGMKDARANTVNAWRSEEHTSELQSRLHLVCRLLLEKKKKKKHLTSLCTNKTPANERHTCYLLSSLL